MQRLRLLTQHAIVAEPPEKVISEEHGAGPEVRPQQYQHCNLFEVKVAESEPLR